MLVKLYIWLCIFSMWGMILSFHTLISIFFFFYVVLIISSLLIFLKLEYLAYLILLIYLGGILVFFLFTSMLLNINFYTRENEANSSTIKKNNNIFFLILSIKYWFIISLFYQKNTMYYNSISFQYIPDSCNLAFDVSYFFTCLYYEKCLILLLIGYILFFSIYGVLILCYRKCI